MTRAQLAAKRQEFWDTRIGGRAEMWQALRLAAENPADGNAFISGAGLTPLDTEKSDFCFTYDELGNRYEIPMYVMHDPRNLVSEEEAARLAQEQQARPAFAAKTNAVPGQSAALAAAVSNGARPSDEKGTAPAARYKIRLSTGEDLLAELQSTDTIGSLKARIAASKGIAAERQRILYQGRLLGDSVQVGRTGIPEGNVIQVMVARQ